MELEALTIIEVEVLPRVPELVQGEELARVAQVDHGGSAVRTEQALLPAAAGVSGVDPDVEVRELEPDRQVSIDCCDHGPAMLDRSAIDRDRRLVADHTVRLGGAGHFA